MRRRPRVRRRQRAGRCEGGRRAGRLGIRPAGPPGGDRSRAAAEPARAALRRGADHGRHRVGGDPQRGALRRRRQGQPAQPAPAAPGGRGGPGPAGRPARAGHRRQRNGRALPADRAVPVACGPTRSPMRWPGTGCGARRGRCAGPTRTGMRRSGACARTWPWPACSAGCAWPIRGWAPSTGSPPQPARGCPRRTGRSAPPCSPPRWTSTCGRYGTGRPEHPALPRFAEVAALLTGRSAARPEDAIGWLEDADGCVVDPGLAGHGLDEAGIPDLVAAAEQASSMRANPIELTDAELTEIVVALALTGAPCGRCVGGRLARFVRWRSPNEGPGLAKRRGRHRPSHD